MGKLERLAINDEGFIFDPETGNSYTVNRTGIFMINLLKKGKSEDEIVRALIEEFEVDEETAKKDIIDFLEHLRLLGLWEASNV